MEMSTIKIDLSGKVALVTGGSRGIGRGIVESLSESGADVVINYHTSEDEARSLASHLEEENDGRAIPIQADVTSWSEVKEMMDKVKDEFGKIDILVNNAGALIERCKTEEMSEELWDSVLDLNAKGVFLTVRQAIPLMKTQDWGRIINISSMAATSGGGTGAGHYAAAKAAVSTLTKNMANELAEYNITVNAVEPGIIDAGYWYSQGISSEELKERFTDSIPLGRVGVPEDVANLVTFLASSQSEYITGAAIPITGGH